MGAKFEMVSELRKMLHDVFVAKSSGADHPRFSRAQGYVDGYMRALLDSGLATKGELLQIVSDERARVDGPAIRDLDARDEVAA